MTRAVVMVTKSITQFNDGLAINTKPICINKPPAIIRSQFSNMIEPRKEDLSKNNKTIPAIIYNSASIMFNSTS